MKVFALLMMLSMVFVGSAFGEIYQFERMWPELEQPWYFNSPQGIAVDSAGNVYVADSYNHRIQKFMRRGFEACAQEWKLICAAHNLLKLWRSGKMTLNAT